MEKVYMKACAVASAVQYDGMNGRPLVAFCRSHRLEAVELFGSIQCIAIESQFGDIEKSSLYPGHYLVQYESGAIKVMTASEFESRFEIVKLSQGEEFYRNRYHAARERVAEQSATIDRLNDQVKYLKQTIAEMAG
jgi:hypothetical protein